MTDDLGATIAEIVGRLEDARIPYMVVGSIAALVHGRTRSTTDVDIVVAPDGTSLRAFVEALPSTDWYVSMQAAAEALQHRSQFNVLDLRHGWKVDLMVRKTRPFSREEFDRRLTKPAFGRALQVATIEDVIIAKLEWAHIGGSERQIEDVRALVELAGADLDVAHIERHSADLGLSETWMRARSPDAMR